MVGMLWIALAVTAFGCAISITLYRRLRVRVMDIESQHGVEMVLILNDLNEKRRFLTDLLHVLNCNVGGISKRIQEGRAIADTVHTHAPDLFKTCRGLTYWLDANDQFLANLYKVAEEGIDHHHREHIHAMKRAGQSAMFGRIYDGAGLPSPPYMPPSSVSAKRSSDE